MVNDIDFVILWVDGNDPKWQKEYQDYAPEKKKKEVYFRDWDNLHYIFRAFEEFTPWVRKIHFVTWGHLPTWLNANHPKINIVSHKDILCSENIPVFNSNAIEPHIHKIKDLAEHFVLFNDDLFLLKQLNPERFFLDNLPCDSFISNALSSSEGVGHFVLNNLEILNRHFNKGDVLKQHFVKCFHPKYGKDLVRNIALLPWPRFTGFVDPHQPQPFLKSTFEEVWEKEHEILDNTSASKFRKCTDTNQYLFRYWQLAKGQFTPISTQDSKYVTLNIDDIRSGKISEIIASQKYTMVCLNDNDAIESEEDFEEAKRTLQKVLDTILPNKSSFEV